MSGRSGPWAPAIRATGSGIRGRNAPRASAPSGSVSTALASILLASSALGPEPAVYATIPPSWQSTGGERHALPSRALIPGDVRQPLLIRPFGREVAVGEVVGSRRRLALFDRRRRPAPGSFSATSATSRINAFSSSSSSTLRCNASTSSPTALAFRLRRGAGLSAWQAFLFFGP